MFPTFPCSLSESTAKHITTAFESTGSDQTVSSESSGSTSEGSSPVTEPSTSSPGQCLCPCACSSTTTQISDRQHKIHSKHHSTSKYFYKITDKKIFFKLELENTMAMKNTIFTMRSILLMENISDMKNIMFTKNTMLKKTKNTPTSLTGFIMDLKSI